MKKIVIILFLLVWKSVPAQSLDEYLKIAEKDNPKLKSEYLEFEASLQKISMVRSLPDPNLTVSAFGQMIETRLGPQRAIFILNQMFPWFGTLSSQGDVMTLASEAKFQSWLNERNILFLDVKSAWYEIYELDQIIKYQHENRELLESFKLLAVSKFRSGSGSMVDVIRTDIMLEDVLTDIKILEEKRKPVLARFNTLLNRDRYANVLINDTLVADLKDLSPSNDIQFDQNPMITEIDKKMELWQKQSMLVKKQGMPKLGLGLNYTIIGKRTDMDVADNGKDAIMPMVSFSLPIYRKKYKAAAREAQLMQNSLSEMKIEMNNTLNYKYEMSRFELRRSVEELELIRKQIESTKTATDLLLSAYTNSGKEFEEVLRMQQMLLKYYIKTANATREFFTAKANLEYLKSK